MGGALGICRVGSAHQPQSRAGSAYRPISIHSVTFDSSVARAQLDGGAVRLEEFLALANYLGLELAGMDLLLGLVGEMKATGVADL